MGGARIASLASISMPSMMASNSARGSAKRAIGAASARAVGRLGRAVDGEIVAEALGQRAQRVGGEGDLVGADRLHAQALQILDRGRQTDAVGRVRPERAVALDQADQAL